MVGPVLDADGVAVTGGVVADFKVSKNGGAPAALDGSATLTHRHTGFYSLALTANDLDTVGTAQVTIDDTVNACPMLSLQVVEEAIYDALFAASANAWSGAAGSSIGVANMTQLAGSATPVTNMNVVFNTDFATNYDTTLDRWQVDVDAISGDTTAPATLELFAEALDQTTGQIDAGTFAAGAIDAASTAADFVTEIRNAITGGAYALDTDANGRIRIVDGTAAGEINTNAGAIALVDAVTLVNGLAANVITAAATAADFGTEVGTAVWATATRVLTAATNISGPIADQVWEEALADHSGTAGSTAEALNAAGSAGDPWVTALPGAYGAGSAGFILGTNLNATVSSRASQTSVDTIDDFLDSEIAAILADTNELQLDWANGGRLDLLIDAILDDTGTSGVVVNAAGLATDAVQEIRNAITGGAYALDTDANGRVRIVDGTAAGELDTSAGHVTLADGSLVTAKLGTFALAKTTNITGFNDLSAAAVNAELVDCLNVDTYAEPGQGAPAATASLVAKIGHLYKAARNKKTQTATTFSLFADDATTVDTKSTVSDDGTTFTFGELVTGP